MKNIKAILILTLLLLMSFDVGSTKVTKANIVKNVEVAKINVDDVIMSIEKISDIEIPDYVDDKYIMFAYNTANEFNIPIKIAFRVMYVESRFKINAVSPVGAKGMMQIMDNTRDYHIKKQKLVFDDNLDDVEKNIVTGMSILKYQYERFGSWKNALIAYNAGASYVYENKELPSKTKYYYKFILDENKN